MKIYNKKGDLIFEGTNFVITNLQNADFRYANFGGVNFTGTDLQNADFRYANLKGANLHGTNLKGANLHGTNLKGANLHGANLQDTNLRGADLDFLSGIPLWCGGQDFIIDEEQFLQILCHVFSAKCENNDFNEIKKNVKNICKKSHIANYMNWLKKD
jgi:hypothetical protein